MKDDADDKRFLVIYPDLFDRLSRQDLPVEKNGNIVVFPHTFVIIVFLLPVLESSREPFTPVTVVVLLGELNKAKTQR